MTRSERMEKWLSNLVMDGRIIVRGTGELQGQSTRLLQKAHRR